MADVTTGAAAAAVPPPPTQRELGELTAQTLMQEMRFLNQPRSHKDDDKLITIPERDKLDFQVIDGEPAAKSRDLMSSVAGLKFCVTDGEIGRSSMFDIDHTVPFKHIHEKQEALLKYLNDPKNKGFKDGFLSAVTPDGVSIAQYFGVDTQDNVQGKRRFYKLCYNDIDNLLLLCHACNITKGTQDSLTWFRTKEPYLGQHFVDAVVKAGGLQEGIILRKVCPVGASKTVKIGDVECLLHEGVGQGLGSFINTWFEKENPSYVNDITQAYKDIWVALKETYEQRLGKAPSAARAATASVKVTGMIKALIDTFEQRYKIRTIAVAGTPLGSESSADAPPDSLTIVKGLEMGLQDMMKYVHMIKSFAKELLSKYPTLVQEHPNLAQDKIALREILYKHLETSGLGDLGKKDQKLAVEDIYKSLLPEYKLCSVADLVPERGKIYLKNEGGQFQYTVINPEGGIVTGVLDNIAIDLSRLDDKETLSKILAITSERGHTIAPNLNKDKLGAIVKAIVYSHSAEGKVAASEARAEARIAVARQAGEMEAKQAAGAMLAAKDAEIAHLRSEAGKRLRDGSPPPPMPAPPLRTIPTDAPPISPPQPR